ncbi:hypothetical protein [Aquimarina macrocephali]|uniref:hypothetical protein n=1 Tax=Aquimarina macrocephali TaxID=666563 RepID=UPI003F680B12
MQYEMNEFYKQIESRLNRLGLPSKLKQETLSTLPNRLKEIHLHKVFGTDLLAVPAELIIEGDDEEYEKPFSFLDLDEGLENFENEFRPEIPNNFIPFGYLYGASEIVLYNNTNDSVHIFHVSDIVDSDWIKYKLDNSVCSFEKFIKEIKPQTVTCLINPNDYSEAVLIEIRADKIYCDYELEEFNTSTLDDYYIRCKSLIEKGLEIHYAPKKVKLEFEK